MKIAAWIKRFSSFIKQWFPQLFSLLLMLLAVALLGAYGRTIFGETGYVTLLAAAVTGFGIMANSFIRQLHERMLTDRVTLIASRREAYKELARSLALISHRLELLGNTQKEASDLLGPEPSIATAITNVALVADKSMLDKMFTLIVEYEKVFKKIFRAREHTDGLRRELKKIEQELAFQHQARERLIQRSNELGAMNRFTDEIAAGMASDFKKSEERSMKLFESRDSVSAQFESAHATFIEELRGEIFRVAPMVREVVVEMRIELGIETDVDWFLARGNKLQDALSNLGVEVEFEGAERRA